MVIGLPLATVMGYRPDATETRCDRTQNDRFGEELRTAAGDTPAPSAFSLSRQDLASGTDSRRPAIALDPPVATPPRTQGSGALEWIPPVAAAATGSVRDMESPIPRVKELLTRMGLDPNTMQFELYDDMNSNPLGSGHINHLMRVRTPNGHEENHAVEYILRNPSITANEIAIMARRPPPAIKIGEIT